jgi:hypothetical protein
MAAKQQGGPDPAFPVLFCARLHILNRAGRQCARYRDCRFARVHEASKCRQRIVQHIRRGLPQQAANPLRLSVPRLQHLPYQFHP